MFGCRMELLVTLTVRTPRGRYGGWTGPQGMPTAIIAPFFFLLTTPHHRRHYDTFLTNDDDGIAVYELEIWLSWRVSKDSSFRYLWISLPIEHRGLMRINTYFLRKYISTAIRKTNKVRRNRNLKKNTENNKGWLMSYGVMLVTVIGTVHDNI